jgi:RNA polymerase sigma-70 factor, ECF subfamily
MNEFPCSFSEQVRDNVRCIAESGSVALGGLYDLTATRLVRFAVTITRNQHDAEDVVQAVLVRVVSHARLLSQVQAPWSYLLRMVRNESIVVLRKKKRWSVVQGLMDLITQRKVDEVEQEDSYRAIWIALRELPVQQSEVVVLKIWEEFTFDQIANVLNIPAATAASRYRYALRKLEVRLRSQLEGIRS